MKKTKDKKIEVYVIKDRTQEFVDDMGTIPNIVSIVTNKEQAEEFINRKLFLDNESHFKLWCKFRNLECNEKNWSHYRKSCLKNNPYYYFKNNLNYSTIVSTFRIFYGCSPIGCSFDTILEKANALIQLPQEELDEINDAINEGLKNQKPN